MENINEMEEFSVGQMLPVVPINSDEKGNSLSDTSIEEIIDSNNKEFSKEDAENNVIGDTINKLFDSLDLGLKEDDCEECNEIPTLEGYCFFDEEEELYTESKKDIDEDIKDVIDTLNEKGYITKYSCSGHPSGKLKKDRFRDGILHKKLYSTARIVFAKDYDLPSIPKHWELKVLDEDKTAIYVKPPVYKITDGLPIDAFNRWKAKYMSTLRTWVEKLPKEGEKPEEVSLESVIDDLYINSL